MKNFVKKPLLFLLVLHGFGINVIGFIVYSLVFRTHSLIDVGLVWLISFQLNLIGFYFYQKYYPDMVTDPMKKLRSPWVIDLFT